MADQNKASAQEPIIFLDNISVTFRTRTGSLFHPNLVHAVQGVTVKLMPGETIGIVGESGCGKSTTANVMCGLQSPTSGHVYFKGEDVTKRSADMRKKIGRVVSVVFQDPATALNPRMIIHDQLLDPMLVHKTGSTQDQEKRIDELIQMVGLPHSSVRAQILNLLTDLKRDFGLSMIFISHDIQTVRYISDRIIVMNHGQIMEEGPAQQVFNNPQDEYTKTLLGAAPSLLHPKLGQ